jgi:hypothetical protein
MPLRLFAQTLQIGLLRASAGLRQLERDWLAVVAQARRALVPRHRRRGIGHGMTRLGTRAGQRFGFGGGEFVFVEQAALMQSGQLFEFFDQAQGLFLVK